MKKVFYCFILLLGCSLIMFSCTDTDKGGKGDAPIITSIPDVDTPLSAGSSITIEGSGFAEDCEVELWTTSNTRASRVVIPVEVTRRTASSITFIAPVGVEGVCDVVVKQSGESFVVGQISLTTNGFVGKWRWLESVSDGEHEYYDNNFFVMNADGTGSYLQGTNIVSLFEWSANGETELELRFIGVDEGETLHLIVKELTGDYIKLQYEVDGVTWTEVLQRGESVEGGSSADPRIVSTMDSHDITNETAVCNGIYLGKQKADEVGICYSLTNEAPRVTDAKVVATIGNDGAFSGKLSGLQPDELYYWRAYAIVGKVTYYGSMSVFNTLGVWTVDARNVTFTSAKCAGSVSLMADIYKYGICYSAEKQEPTVYDSKKETDVNGVDAYGRFDMELSNLEPSQLYNYRAYLTLEDGKVLYGEVKTFQTAGCVTGNSSATEETAICVGQYVAPELSPDTPTEFGIYYGIGSPDNKMQAPNIELGNNSFRVSLSGLEANKTYKYQAYVVVNGETYLGKVKTFVTEKGLYGTWRRISFVSYDRESGGQWRQETETDNNFVVTYHQDGTCVIAHGNDKISGTFAYDELEGRLSTTYGGKTEQGTVEMNVAKTRLKFTTDMVGETVNGVLYEHYAVTEWNKIADE